MKTILIITMTILCFSTNWGQDKPITKEDSVYNIYQAQLDTILKRYHCQKDCKETVQAVQDSVLSKSLYGIYQAIIPNAQGTGSNNSAFTYSHDEDKQTLAISASFPCERKTLFLSTGIKLEGSDGLFNLYSSGSWNNNVAFSLGLSGVIWSSQYFNQKKCEEYISERKVYADSLLLHYGQILSEKKMLDSTQKDLICTIQKLRDRKTLRPIKKETRNYIKELNEVTKKIEKYNQLVEAAGDSSKVLSKLSQKLAEFDTRKNILYGYNVLWWQVSSTVANTTINITDSLYDSGKRRKNHPTVTFNLGLMFNHLGAKTLCYFSADFSIMRGNFLNDPTLKGDPSIIYTNDIPYVFVKDRKVGTFDDLLRPVWQYTFSVYHANFCSFDRSLGYSIKTTHNFASKLNTFDYRNNYSIMVGPIFRSVNEADFAKATFGIYAGLFNTPYNARAKDYFAVQAFIGLPFDALIKK